MIQDFLNIINFTTYRIFLISNFIYKKKSKNIYISYFVKKIEIELYKKNLFTIIYVQSHELKINFLYFFKIIMAIDSLNFFANFINIKFVKKWKLL